MSEEIEVIESWPVEWDVLTDEERQYWHAQGRQE